jgi:hypothetical protein
MNRYLRSVAVGALAGVGATVPMTAFMKVTHAAGALGELPPRKIVRHALRRVGVRPSKRGLAAATIGAHFAFGAAVGAVMALLRELEVAERTKRSAMKLASTVWAGAYQGVIPAMGIMPRPKHDRRFRPTAMLGAHWIYGLAFDEIVERLG